MVHLIGSCASLPPIFIIKKMKTSKLAILLAVCAGTPVLANASCGAAFCTVNTNWTSENAMINAGSSFDLRYEYIKQDQPRSGTEKVAVGQIGHHHDEVQTINRNLVATYNRTFESGWGISVTAPVIDRDHVHLHNHHGEQLPEEWKFTELGDIRVIGRYQLPSAGEADAARTTGFSFGLKLPTGKTTIRNDAGSPAERSLQPGTGTTDLVLGAYHHQQLLALDSSWFAQVQYQHALNSHDQYKPGRQFGADVGYRYNATDKLGALVQLNMLFRGRDAGSEAEPADSGGRYAFISPGLSYALSDAIEIYGFYQHPVYQRVNGVQLTSSRGLLVGVSGRF
jgi:hypothetical protein